MRQTRKLGPLLAAALALAAFAGTTSASATSTFTASGAGKVLSSTQLAFHFFSVEGYEIGCTESAFAGQTVAASSKTQPVVPSYKGCTDLARPATITIGTCELVLEAGTDEAEMAAVELTGCADPTKGIHFEVNNGFTLKCIWDMPEQRIPSAVHYTNTTSSPEGMGYEVELTMTEIMVDVTASQWLCPLKVGTNATGTYIGKSELTALKSGATWSE